MVDAPPLPGQTSAENQGSHPEPCVFPGFDRIRSLDPTPPMNFFKGAWDRVRRDAAVECRFHGLRHSSRTKMAEAGVSERTMLVAGTQNSRLNESRFAVY